MFARNICFSCFLFFCFTIGVFVLLLCLDFNPVSKYRLEKVLILSRHNLRTPMSKNLEKITPLEWPRWAEKPGYLTEKGFLLEGYMGSYFKNWLNREGLLLKTCPEATDFLVYANNVQRTMLSAQAFILNAFPNCNISIHHSSNKTDPIFSPYIHNNTETFREIAIEEMQSALKTVDLKTSYEKMENILDYRESDSCRIDKKCDMFTETNMINITFGAKPTLTGPVKLCNEAIDAFFMEYYTGLSLNSVAWGKLQNINDWQSILTIPKHYHNVVYNTSIVAKDISRPLIKYMSKLFLSNDPKVSLLMGHDANINTVIRTMEFKHFELNEEFVSTPIGGKILFQKWLNYESKEYMLKIQYVYQSKEQIRNNSTLSEENPPQFTMLELKNCPVNKEGFCSWDTFVEYLHTITQND